MASERSKRRDLLACIFFLLQNLFLRNYSSIFIYLFIYLFIQTFVSGDPLEMAK